ncbi:type VI secretion system Vgr family protein [Flavobacterium branchiicola]|uniref:Type VI secretion system Vgr family protein n=1 Tax=Flavobacterium branchiicola TaxID=1114875 RepID=A0ABV9PIK2_9FLAO|nr:phage baseplate assembly protein V [Flavobacterium branchiicola]MBS7256331.1 Vgr family protein [Flavobacterium branchiicola]
MIKGKIIFGIDSKEISHFTSIELNQSINNHHHFNIKVPHSVIEKPRAYTMQNAQNWLGKVVHIRLENNNNFLGIITNIELELNADLVGSQIILSGYSKTILLESGQKMHSWEDSSIQYIVKEIIKNSTDEQLQNEIEPEFATILHYQTQYLETDFEFIQRLAKQYNEWLFYDGEKLFFGKPKNSTANDKITLTFNRDLYTFNIGIQTKPVHFEAFTYNEDINKLYQAKTQNKVEGLPIMGEQAFDTSEKLYKTASFEYGRFATGYDANLELALKKRQEATMADANYITATSSNKKLKIGAIVIINALEEIGNTVDLGLVKKQFKPQEIGQYIITEITHKANHLGKYENNFKALPAFIKKLPEPQINFPQAQTQQAIVIDNADPKNQGRIRVKMLWQQAKNLRTPWIRVMTPDAGSSSEVAKNRGMVFIPEIGDHVMLGFRYNDPNRPFVIGSIFNGATAKGGQANNKIKSLSSKSGNIIKLDDHKGSVYISDKGTSNMKFDGAGSATTNANVNHNVNAGSKHAVNVGATKEQPPQTSLAMNADGSIVLDGKTSITIKVEGNTITIDKEGIKVASAEGIIDLTTLAGALSVSSKGTMDINTASDLTITAGPSANISSGDTNIM